MLEAFGNNGLETNTCTLMSAGFAPGVVPSPWTEAAKGLFKVARIPVACVRSVRGDAAQASWTQAQNAPVVFHEDDQPRTTAYGFAADT